MPLFIEPEHFLLYPHPQLHCERWPVKSSAAPLITTLRVVRPAPPLSEVLQISAALPSVCDHREVSLPTAHLLCLAGLHHIWAWDMQVVASPTRCAGIARGLFDRAQVVLGCCTGWRGWHTLGSIAWYHLLSGIASDEAISCGHRCVGLCAGPTKHILDT